MFRDHEERVLRSDVPKERPIGCSPYGMKRDVVFQLDRVPGLTPADRDEILRAPLLGRKVMGSGSQLVITALGLAYLPGRIGDPKAWIGSAVAGVTAGAGTFLMTPLELLVSEAGSAAAEAVNARTLEPDVERSLRHPKAFVVPGVTITDVAVVDGFLGARQLEVASVGEDDARTERVVRFDGLRPRPTALAPAVILCRAQAEAVAAVRAIAREGHATADVPVLARDRLGDAAARFSPWPDAHRAYWEILAGPNSSGA